MTGNQLIALLQAYHPATLDYPIVFTDHHELVEIDTVRFIGLNERGDPIPPDEAPTVLGPKDKDGIQKFGVFALQVDGGSGLHGRS